MQKAVFNIETLKVTQGMNGEYSHKGDLAIDIGAVCKNLKAPFTGTIKRIYSNCNAVWLESNEKVMYADGTVDYMTVMTIHDNDVSNLKVGKVIEQGEIYYQPGTKGQATGSHIHIAIGKGKFSGTGWYKNSYGNWCINNQYNIVDGLFLYDKVNIQYAMYDWKRTSDFVVNEITPNVERDESKNQVEVIVDKLRVRTEPNLNGSILGYAKIGFYNVYEQKENDGYIWFKIADNQWIATDEEWTIYYPAIDYKRLYEEALEEIQRLEITNNNLVVICKELQSKIDKAIEDLK